tara:strand:+ start:308 stop:637 length:330 start_codon:yes stop_codon:yes gene_type:complete
VNEENVADVQAEVVGPGEFAAPVTRVATKNSLHMSFSPVDKFTSHLTFAHASTADTPFDGGIFRMKLLLPSDFPQSAPKGMEWYHAAQQYGGEISLVQLVFVSSHSLTV